jgi:hypothetical protein
MRKKQPTEKVVQVVVERHIPLEEKTCPVCEKKFIGAKVARYCSSACRNKAAYWRNPKAYRASRMKSYRKQKAAGPRHPAAGKKRRTT